RDEKLRKEKQTSKKTSSTKDVDSSSSKGRGDGEASGSMVGQVEPTLSLAPEAGEDFKAVTTAVQANPLVVLLDSGCLHHLMGTKEVFVDMALSGDVKHVREFNWALQTIEGRGIVALQGEAGKQVLILDMLYVPSVVALRTIASATKLTPDRWHARLAHVGINTIKSSAKHEVATGLDIDLCGPFHVAAKDGSLYFLLLKDRHNRYMWVTSVAKKSNILWVFEKWLLLVERQAKKTVLVEDKDVDDEGELSTGEESTDSDVVEVPIEKQELRRSGQSRKPPERLSFHACLPPSAFTTLLYGAEADVDLPELNLDVHADPNHRSDIAMMTVKEALAKWKGKAVKVVVECIDGVDTVDVSNVADASVEEV
ncbi:unnamed protein product, partial [Closterium sp. NIES-53]